jgi:hypothetical protein
MTRTILKILLAIGAVASVAILLNGCGSSDQETTGTTASVPEAERSLEEKGVPGEDKAFVVDVSGMTISDADNEYVVARSLTEYLRSRMSAAVGQAVMPECHLNTEGTSPNQYECYTPVPEAPSTRVWNIYSVNKQTGHVTEVAHGTLP